MGRRCLGLPSEWSEVQKWLEEGDDIDPPAIADQPKFQKIWERVPTLLDYRRSQGQEFWENFPTQPLPTAVYSSVNVNRLEKLCRERQGLLTRHQVRRAHKACHDLRYGAESYQRENLPPTTVPNAESMYAFGELFTDKLATWVDKGFVSGPFRTPPLPGFRSNSIIAVVKHGKVRPVVNLSAPEGASFNDNVKSECIEKVHMSTAQSFGYSVREAGIGAVMSKFDLKDAYKIVPARRADWRLQGFQWLGRYFVETKMTFGAETSVSNFDRVGNTLQAITKAVCKIPRRFLGRTLDDFTVVSPKSSGWCEEFTREFKGVCKKVNIQLAANCPQQEKAFENMQRGVVLGVRFDTKDLTWEFTEEKASNLVTSILTAIQTEYLSLQQMQKLMGEVNDFAQMCPFIKAFKHPANAFMGAFGTDKQLLLPMPAQVAKDLRVCARAAQASKTGLPISARPGGAPLGSLVFVSDAAGAAFTEVRGVRIPTNCSGDRGVACIGTDAHGDIVYWSQVTWPMYLLAKAVDRKGAHFGCKTATLEAVGTLLPFLTIPEALRGRHVILKLDNMAVVHGWASKGVRKDVAASILIRAIHLIGSYLGCMIHVEHLPRMSSDLSKLADHLSRKATTSAEDLAEVTHVPMSIPHPILGEWLERPCEDWDLALRLLEAVKNMIE